DETSRTLKGMGDGTSGLKGTGDSSGLKGAAGADGLKDGRWQPQGYCSDALAASEKTLRWADREAHRQAWSFLAEESGLKDAVSEERITAAAVGLAGPKRLKDDRMATKAKLDEAKGYFDLLQEALACAGRTPLASANDCLNALMSREAR